MSKISITPNPSGSGVFTISSPATSTDRTLTLPDEAGTVLTSASSITQNAGPAFSAYQYAGGQSLPSVSTKIIFDTEEFDTDSCFNTSTYSFTPNVAGYYQLEFLLCFDPLTANEVTCFLFKNGVQHKRGTRSQVSGQALYLICSTLVYANGTTDYFDAYAYQSTGSNKNLEAGLNAKGNYFQGFLVRAAS
tara:strand:+ start:244 stop:816 length:573 start_codon:yes stop_codon:yes gene_type:complete